MATERFTFAGHDGVKLAARLDRPDGPHLATAIFAHCFTCGKDIAAARRIAARLSDVGIAVLRFDFTGLGHSEGEFENTDFSSNINDLIGANTALTNIGMPPSMLIGHSLGGAAALSATTQLDNIKAVVTVGAPSDPAHVIEHFGSAVDDIEKNGHAEVCLGGRPFKIGKGFLETAHATNLKQSLHGLNAALLVLHAPRDEIVSVDNAAEIFLAAKHPKSFITLDDADHLISQPEDADYVADLISTWATRYLELLPPAPPPGAPEGIIRVSEADPDGFMQDIQSGPFHHTRADEPLAYGGTNKGMSPYGFLSAGLGACTSMTIRMYARRKSWPLHHVWVDVSHDKVHAQDAETGTRAKIDTFRREVHLRGNLTEAQRQRLLEIADRCPVHRTLEATSNVETILAEAP